MGDVKRLLLAPSFSNIIELENFIADLRISDSDDKKSAVLIVATEIFSNIVEHAYIPEGEKVLLEIKEGDFIGIKFSYMTINFDDLLQALKNPHLYLDIISNRYRGLGLFMVNNLARHVDYKKSEYKSSICVIL